MTLKDTRPFDGVAGLDRWLESDHATRTELWVRVFEKGSSTPSVTRHTETPRSKPVRGDVTR